MSLRRNLFSQSKGFTLVEVLIASAVTVVFFGAFVAVSIGFQKVMVCENVYFDANRAARYSVDRISRDIKEALSVEYTHGGFTRSGSTLILKLPSIDGSYEPTDLTAEFDYVIYRLSANQILRTLDVDGASQREGGADQSSVVVAKHINSLAFSSGGTALGSFNSTDITGIESLNVAITALGTTLGLTQSIEVDSDIMLRNHIS